MGTQTTAQGAQAVTEVQLPSQNNTAIARMQEETVNRVLDRVSAMQEAGELVLPNQYHAGNALKSAWLYLQTIETRTKQKAIDVCTKDSICNCLLEMVIKGEHPKQHCYFIPCADKLEFWERYTGKLMRAKRDTCIEKVNPQVIYEGDNFTYTVDEDGLYQLVKHETSMSNIDLTKITGAYAVVINKDGSRHIEVMNIDQIRKAWQQGAAKGTSGAHTNFTDQMCKKTIIARACKVELDTTSDNEEEELRMTPPSEEEAMRAAAQQPQNLLEEGADYEDVTGEDNQPAPAPEPKAEPAKQAGRKMPEL